MRNKFILILASSLIAFCQGDPECDAKQCKDLWTAKKCDKVKFCIAEHWSKLKPTGNRDNVCDICLRMVKEARDTLQSNETREELLQVFEGSCRLLLLKPAVEVCDKIVDQYVPELVEILSSQMDPEAVCSVARLCNNEAFRTTLKNSNECTYCQKFTEDAAKKMETISSEQFENKILNLCRSAGTFSDACAHFGLEYSSLIYNNSKIILSKNPCEVISVCPSGLVNSQSAPETKKEMCPLCVDVMTNFREQLLRVKSAEEFDYNILSVCERMGFPSSACSKISKPSLYDKLKNWDKFPNVFCQMTYCRRDSEKDVPVWPLVPAHNETFGSANELDALVLLENVQLFFPIAEESNIEAPRPVISYGDRIENPVFFAPQLLVADLGNCKMCVNLLKTLSNSTKMDKKDSEKIFNTTCDETEDVEMCKRFISNFSPFLTKAYAEGFVSTKMCEDLVPSCKVKRYDSPAQVLPQNNTCNFCLNIVRVLKYYNFDTWNKMVAEICNPLVENTRNACMSTFGQFPSIFKNDSEIEICHSVQLCSSSAATVSIETEVELEKNSYCKICLNTLQGLRDIVKNPESGIIIRIVFDSLCTLLPYEESRMCRNLFDVIGINEIKKLIENLQPAEVCFKIHFCQEREESNFTVTPDVSTEVVGADSMGKIPCKFCLMAIKTLLDQLQDDKTEETIRKALDNLCKYFPEETRDTCRNLIDEYAEDLIDMIIADFNASEICMYLKICPAKLLPGADDKKDFPTFDVHTNEVRDENSWKRTYSPKDDNLGKPGKEDLQRLHKVVQECALCEALVEVISTHKQMLDKNYDFSSNARYICSIVPADKRKACMSMVVSYGPSIVNLIVDHNVDLNEICVRVDLCDPKMQAKVNLPVSVKEEKFVPEKKNDCMLGPVFWCANAENAEKCGTFLHCQETVWKNWKNPPKRPVKNSLSEVV